MLVLRGILFKSLIIRRDLEDDFRFFVWESLKGLVRFKIVFDVLKLIANKYGGGNVCIAGYLLGVGFVF